MVCATSSHFATAERQFRIPLELGTPKTPTSQNTATAAGAVVLSAQRGQYPSVISATPGRVVDLGINDVNNMGAAMAPAAAETIITHLEDIGQRPEYYDAIITGDLGIFGSELSSNTHTELGWDHRCPQGLRRDAGTVTTKMMHCCGSGCGLQRHHANGYFLRR